MKKAIVFVVLVGLFTAIGSVYQLAIVPYVVVASVILVTMLAVFNKINNYPVYIYGLALSLIWQTSMLGTHIVGVDIHSEYYVVQTTLNNGWDWNWGNIGNTSVVLTVIAPVLQKIGFSVVWQFKILYPAICALTPVVLYYAFKNMFGEKKAYFGVLFFMIMPMYTMEAASMVKTQWAYLFLAGIVWCFTTDMKVWKKTLAVTGLAVGTVITHYTVGIITVMLLIGISLFLLVTNWGRVKELVGVRTYPLKAAYTVSAISLGFMVLWFSSIGSGGILNVTGNIFRGLSYNLGITKTSVEDEGKSTVLSSNNETPQIVEPERDASYLNKQSGLVTTALGLDFAIATIWGKLFRIMQYITQLLILVGLVVVWAKRKVYKIKAEYGAGVVGCFVLIMCGLFVPNFTLMTTTTTRLYMITLLFISPLLVIGAEWTINKVLRCEKESQLVSV